MTAILAIDPGKTTGLAIKIDKKIRLLEITDYPVVWWWVANNPWDHVVCEGFVAQHISRFGLLTVRIIGGVEAICREHGIPYTIQPSGRRVPFLPKAIEIIERTHGKRLAREHRQDAFANLLEYEYFVEAARASQGVHGTSQGTSPAK